MTHLANGFIGITSLKTCTLIFILFLASCGGGGSRDIKFSDLANLKMHL
jgi:hypothetical protein